MPGLMPDPLFLAALRARTSRLRGDVAGYGRACEAALRLAWARDIAPFGVPPDGFGRQISAVEPLSATRGGWFSTIAEVATGARFFVKAVTARGREAAFWRAWSAGCVTVEGTHFRLVPPLATAGNGPVTLLVFPEVRALRRRPRRRQHYRSALDRTVKAMAEFAALHPAERAPLPAAYAPVRATPSARSIGGKFGLSRSEAAAVARRLRAVEAAWPRPDPGQTSHLAHLDLGPGNVRPTRRTLILHDFGHVAAAAPGADLHSVLRWARALGGPPPDLGPIADAYAGVFTAVGVAVDASDVRRAAERHFAVRYRNPRQSSSREVFAEALALSEQLLDAG